MPKLMTAGEIAIWALRKVMRMTPKMTSPDPGDLQVALEALDMALAELAGVEGIWWLKPISQEVPLTASDGGPYDLTALLDPRLESFERAFLVTDLDPGGTEIAMMTRAQYEARPDPTGTGTTVGVYIERGTSPQMYVYPVPSATTTDKIRLYGQTYTQDLTEDKGNVPHNFPAAWQLWQINKVAAIIGDGPVAMMPESKLKSWKDEASDQLSLLKTLSNRQNLVRPTTQTPDNLSARRGSVWFR